MFVVYVFPDGSTNRFNQHLPNFNIIIPIIKSMAFLSLFPTLTPLKINMEPKDHPVDLPNPAIVLGSSREFSRV